MAMKCFNCGKGIMYGLQHSHHAGVAGGRWKKRAPKTQKVFKPNLHSARIQLGVGKKTVRLCTKCLRLLKPKKIVEKNEETPVITSAV